MPSRISVAAVVAAVFIVGTAITPSANAAPSDDACSLLTQAQVSAAVGVPVGAGQYQGPDKKVCAWNRTANATEGAKFVTLLLQGRDAFQAGKQASVKTIVVTPVTGTGDDAYYLAVGDNVGLIVKKGKVAFKVAVYGQLSFEKKQSLEKTLAQQIVLHL